MDLQEFLAALRETPRSWSLDGGQLRCGIGGSYCPIEAVVLMRQPHVLLGDTDTAARDLGLPEQLVDEIMNAADSTCYVEPLRKQLLEACGIA